MRFNRAEQLRLKAELPGGVRCRCRRSVVDELVCRCFRKRIMNLQRIARAIIRIPFLGNGGDGKRQRTGGGQQTWEQFSKIQREVIDSLFSFGGLACSMREARSKCDSNRLTERVQDPM